MRLSTMWALEVCSCSTISALKLKEESCPNRRSKSHQHLAQLVKSTQILRKSGSKILKCKFKCFKLWLVIWTDFLNRSYLKNGESYIQFITKRNPFLSLEGQYTFRTSDRKYHSITYEVPLDDFDYTGVLVREYEISTEENYFKSGTLELALNGTLMDVRYFVNKDGFHVNGIKRPAPPAPLPLAQPLAQTNPLNNQVNLPNNIRPVRNQQPRSRQSLFSRLLNPSFSRPDLLTGNRSVQPGK